MYQQFINDGTTNKFYDIEEEYTILKKIKEERDPNLKQKFVKRHMPYILSRTKRYWTPIRDKEDLIQEAIVGFLVALEKWEPSPNTKLSTVVYRWIDPTLKQFCIQMGGPVSLYKAGTSKTKSIVHELREHRKEKPTIAPHIRENIAIKFKVSRTEVDMALAYMTTPSFSINTPKSVDQSSESLQRYTQDSSNIPSDIIEEEDWQRKITAAINAALSTLTINEQKVIHKMYLTECPQSGASVGRDLNLCQTRISAIKRSAFKKLYKKLYGILP